MIFHIPTWNHHGQVESVSKVSFEHVTVCSSTKASCEAVIVPVYIWCCWLLFPCIIIQKSMETCFEFDSLWSETRKYHNASLQTTYTCCTGCYFSVLKLFLCKFCPLFPVFSACRVLKNATKWLALMMEMSSRSYARHLMMCTFLPRLRRSKSFCPGACAYVPGFLQIAQLVIWAIRRCDRAICRSPGSTESPVVLLFLGDLPMGMHLCKWNKREFSIFALTR